MPYFLDTVGRFSGKFDQSPGGGPWGSSYGGAVIDSLDDGRRRPRGSAFVLGFGHDDVVNTRKFQPDLIDRIYIALNERPDTGKTASQTWADAATGGSVSELQSDARAVISAYYEPISGYPNAPKPTTAYLRIQREMSSSGNELPILNDTDAANAVTFYRREIPIWRQLLAQNGIKLVVHWNNCGGSGSNYNNVLLAYPGPDMVDQIGGDLYDSDDSGIYPYSWAPLWRRSLVGVATAAGATSIDRQGNMVSVRDNDVIEIGTGTANVERVTVQSGNQGSRTATLKTPLQKPHAVGETITKVYGLGDKVSNYAMQYRSLVADNVFAPSPEPWSSTAQWAAYPPEEWTAAELLDAVDRQNRAFRLKFYGDKGDGTFTRYHAQFWYDFARTGVVPAGHSLDPRVPSTVGQAKPFVIPEIGMFGLPSTNFKGASGGGDDYVWAGLFVTWCAAMRSAHPDYPAISWLWFNHNNGTAGAYTQVFATLPPWGVVPQTDGVVRPPYFPRSGRVLMAAQAPAAQPRYVQRRGLGRVLAGTT